MELKYHRVDKFKATTLMMSSVVLAETNTISKLAHLCFHSPWSLAEKSTTTELLYLLSRNATEFWRFSLIVVHFCTYSKTATKIKINKSAKFEEKSEIN